MRYQQYGEMARSYLGYGYQILDATRINIKTELALGRPVIVGVRTHGLGNPHYPGFYSHHEETGWSVSHYIDVVGYDQNDTVILNDPGISAGHGYHITFDQLFFAISDLDQAYPALNEGQVLLDRLAKTPIARADLEETIAQALDGHLCRCTGYIKYHEAVRHVILSDTTRYLRSG